MRVIFAGSRQLLDPAYITQAVERAGFKITLLISGGARGIDTLAWRWAVSQGIPTRVIQPDWNQGRKAGPLRNREMARIGQALIVAWDGRSKGTESMIREALAAGLPIYVGLILKAGGQVPPWLAKIRDEAQNVRVEILRHRVVTPARNPSVPSSSYHRATGYIHRAISDDSESKPVDDL